MHMISTGKAHIDKTKPQQYTYIPSEKPTMTGNAALMKTTRRHVRPWLAEFIWCALALSFFAALVAVLFHFDNHPLPEWPLGLTVNTLIALLSTICRAMVIVPIEEGLSQLKWNWFATGRRPLKHLHDFDQASRGPWGAMCLVPKTRGGFIYFSSVAALVWATGIATSFVTQSTITYRPENILVPNGTASIQVSRSFPQSLLDSGLEDQDVFEGVTRGAYQAAFYTVNQTLPHVEPTCSTLQCEWPPVLSLGLCASIKNVTEYLNVSGPTEGVDGVRLYNASLPNGLGYLNFTDKRHVMTNISSPIRQQPEDDDTIPERRMLSDWDTDVKEATMAHFFIIHSNASPNMKTRFRAMELIWHFCVHDYTVQVKDGIDSTTISSSSVNISSSTSTSNANSTWNSFILSDDKGHGSFNVTTSSIHVLIDKDFRHAFSGSWSSDLNNRFSLGLAYQFGYNLMSGVNPTTPDEEFDNLTWKNLQTYVSNIAEGMTGFIRSADTQGSVRGESFNRETYMFVRWQWLTLLAAQVGFTVAFVVAIVIHTARIGVDVVKSSNAAELFALQEHRSQETRMAEKSQSWGIRTKVGKASEGILVNSGGGWKLQV